MYLGELLVWSGKITDEQLSKALEIQKKTKQLLGQIIVERGYITEDELMRYLSQKMGIAYKKLTESDIDKKAVALVPMSMAKKYQIIPVSTHVNKIGIAMSDPTNLLAIDDISFATGMNTVPILSKQSDILRLIDVFYGKTGTQIEQADSEDTGELVLNNDAEFDLQEIVETGFNIDEVEKSSKEKPIIQFVNKTIYHAAANGCSDIHFEPYENSFRIRQRIDGMLETVSNPPKKLAPAIISRIKIMSKLDIAERRLPQDGRIKVRLNIDGEKRSIDIRTSTIPTSYGEKVVMRLLDKKNLKTDLRDLGLEGNDLDKFKKALSSPYGIILATGPTGSGKSTTLYAALSSLNKNDVNIMTAEDPVEYSIPGMNQINVKESIGLTFATALRSFLRQDPDIIMVGEVRDEETADIAVRAALTGHLVLSTIHTNDASSTISRLVDMGIEPYLITSSLNCIVAQRLVKKICPACKREVDIPASYLLEIGFDKKNIDNIHVYEGAGCKQCRNTGYKGRMAIYELLEITEPMKTAILKRDSASQLRELAKGESMITLRENGLKKVQEGVTTIEEVLRTTTVI